MGYWSGKHFSEEHKEKLSEAKRGNSNAKGKHLHLYFFKESYHKKFEDTDIEIRLRKELSKRGIFYKKQVVLCCLAPVDFYLPHYKMIIQCDGDYWHNLSAQKERDKRSDKILTENGFSVYRFWGHEIKQDVKKCVDEVIDYFQK